ncbi:MAG TPA: DUF4239 domain-containing protein [Ignavibacteria bacterium]|nr:DUF4239 domain-containing protein [Ignavibacteria bacterium]
MSLPTILLTVFVILFGSGISLLLLFYFRKKFKNEWFIDNHEVSSVFFNAFGLLHAVLVAFVVYATWNSYSQADLDVEVEANEIYNLFISVNGLPEEYRPEAKKLMSEYLTTVINEDWDYMQKEMNNPDSKEELVKLWNYYLTMRNIKTVEEEFVYQESLKRLNEITNSRRLRVQSSQNDIPPILWVVIIIGSVSSVVFSLFFKAKNMVLQGFMTATFGALNCLIILLILLLDHPFTGDSGISIEPFVFVLDFMKENMSLNP